MLKWDELCIYLIICVHAKSLQSCLTLCDHMNCSPPAPLSVGFSRQECWSGLPCPPLGDISDPEIEPGSPVSPALQADSLPTEPTGKPQIKQSVCVLVTQSCLTLYDPMDGSSPDSISSRKCS